MRAEIVQIEEGFKAEFNRTLNHRPESVWGMLTENSKLEQWFPELKVVKLQKGGIIEFAMGDGTSEKLGISDYVKGELLAYKWDKGEVRFEIKPVEGGSAFRMVETFPRITPHTPKDLAGWHICLDAIEAILDDREIARKQEWEKEYEEYKRLLDSLSINFE